MMEQLRRLLESYPVVPPMRVQTDLAGARTPGYSLSQKGERVAAEDVLGQKKLASAFTFHLRQVAAGEADRQRAHGFLRELGAWLGSQSGGLTGVYRVAPGPPVFVEAYDDGTAVWSMSIELFWQEAETP